MFKELYTGFLAVLKYHLFESMDVKDVSMQLSDGQPKKWANLKFLRTKEDQLPAEQL